MYRSFEATTGASGIGIFSLSDKGIVAIRVPVIISRRALARGPVLPCAPDRGLAPVG